MKSTKKSTRRWKTFTKRMNRKKVLDRAWEFDWRPDTLNPLFLETPKGCSCSVCSNKNAWDARSRKRNFRDSERQEIDEWYVELVEEIDELTIEINELMGWD